MTQHTKQSKIYLASPWFNEYESQVETKLYETLKRDSRLDVYSPRRDGTKLTPGEFHDHEKRSLVFKDNVDNILDASLVIANFDPYTRNLDTGTVWEVGYAVANNIPVILYTGYSESFGKDPNTPYPQLGGILGFEPSVEFPVVFSLGELKSTYESVLELPNENKLLVVGPFKGESLKVLQDIGTMLGEKGFEYLSIDDLMNEEGTHRFGENTNLTEKLESQLKESAGLIAVIDDRNPLVSMAMGSAYAMGKPMISFTNFDYGVNLMLMLSIARHVKGLDELSEALDIVRDSGFEGLGSQDSSGVRVI